MSWENLEIDQEKANKSKAQIREKQVELAKKRQKEKKGRGGVLGPGARDPPLPLPSLSLPHPLSHGCVMSQRLFLFRPRCTWQPWGQGRVGSPVVGLVPGVAGYPRSRGRRELSLWARGWVAPAGEAAAK